MSKDRFYLSRSWCLLLFGFVALSSICATAQQASDVCWSGTWTGTYSFGVSCGYTDSGNVTLTLYVTNGVVTGSGTEDGIVCYNLSTCEMQGFGTLSGTLTGTTSGNTITLSGNWQNSCNGVIYGTGFGGTLSGCTITGWPNLTLTKQGGCESCFTNSGLTITDSSPLPGGPADIFYYYAFHAEGGQGPYIWSYSGDLDGLTFDTATADIYGEPATAGTFDFVVNVSDSSGDSIQKEFSIN